MEILCRGPFLKIRSTTGGNIIVCRFSAWVQSDRLHHGPEGQGYSCNPSHQTDPQERAPHPGTDLQGPPISANLCIPVAAHMTHDGMATHRLGRQAVGSSGRRLQVPGIGAFLLPTTDNKHPNIALFPLGSSDPSLHQQREETGHCFSQRFEPHPSRRRAANS